VKVASCLVAWLLVSGPASASGATQTIRVRPVTTFASGFDYPLAVRVDPSGALLVADHGRGVIYRISRAR
jgi:glucose/arabinose dehydrogenase